MISLYLGDCLEKMCEIEDQSVDLVLCDLPYGLTACKWDSVIPLDLLWEQYKRVCKPNAAIVLTASQPFTSRLIASNFDAFKYEWIWRKSRATGFLQSKFMPMKNHENICVFCFSGKPTFNPQKTDGHKPTNSAIGYGHSPTFGASKLRGYKGGDTTRNPVTVQDFKSERGLHPTQKPVQMMEYLINTYSNIGDVVLDNCMGSGTSGVAAVMTGRRFIGIERDERFFEIARSRIASYSKIKSE